jgi:hypothetical protein
MSITADDITQLNDQCGELLRRVARKQTPLQMAVGAVQAAIECRFEPAASNPSLILDRYTMPEEQVLHEREWNTRSGSYFDDQQITAMLKTIPDFVWDPSRPLRGLVLCATRNTPAQSVAAAIAIMRWVYGEDRVDAASCYGELTDGDIYLPPGAPEFVPNQLSWEVIDFGANRNTAPDKVDPAIAAGIQVFNAACHHPAAVLQHDGDNSPYWDVPGLRIKVPGDSGPYAPCDLGNSDGCVGVRANWAGDGAPRFSGPVVLRES